MPSYQAYFTAHHPAAATEHAAAVRAAVERAVDAPESAVDVVGADIEIGFHATLPWRVVDATLSELHLPTFIHLRGVDECGEPW